MVVMWKRERCEDGNGDEGDRGSGVWVSGMEHAKKKGRGLKDLNRFFFLFSLQGLFGSFLDRFRS